MANLLQIIIVIIPVLAALITVTFTLRNFLKRPHIHFKLQKGEFTFISSKQQEKLSLLLASVTNIKKSFFGETAKKVSTLLLFRAPSEDDWLGLNASTGLPWLKSFGGKKKIDEKLQSEESIKASLEKYVFDRETKDIPQGMGEFVVVAYGIEKSNRLFFASDPPIEIPLPPHVKYLRERRGVMTGAFFRLGIAGENVPSTMSLGSVIFGQSWKEWGFPTKVETISSTSRMENLKLRLGIGREKQILDTEL